MATIKQIRAGLKTPLATISGMNAYARRPAKLNLPAAVVESINAEYGQTFGDGALTQYRVDMMLLVKTAMTEEAEEELEGYLQPSGATSVRAAIKADSRLGGVADKAFVVRFRDAGMLEYQGNQYLGAVVEVEVWAS